MKKILILSILALMALNIQSQERTVYLNGNKALDLNVSKWYAYNGLTADRLVATGSVIVHDTTDYILQVKNQGSGPLHFYVAFTLDTIASIDTTVRVFVDYKMFSSGTYATLLSAATTAGVIRNDTVVIRTSLGVTTEFTNTIASYTSVTAAAVDLFRGTIIANNDTLTVAQRTATNAAQTVTSVANPVLYYRYLRFRLMLMGNDHVGTGVKIKRIEIQFYN